MTTQKTINLDEMISNFAGEEVISDELFGGIFVGYRSLSRFDNAVEASSLTGIRWPGGAVAEQQEWYGLAFEDLVDPDSNKTGLTEVMAYALSNNLTLSLIIPTARYLSNLELAKVEVQNFLDRLYGGDFGELPRELTIEIGNEYYDQPEFVSSPELFGEISSVILTQVAEHLNDRQVTKAETVIKYVAQTGRTSEENQHILKAHSAEALSVIDAVSHHRFPWVFDHIASHVETVESNVKLWTDASGNADLELYLSAWNVASWTRGEALSKYIRLTERYFDEVVPTSAIDLDLRDKTNFEQYWQTGILTSSTGETIQTEDGVSQRDYGLEQAFSMVELLSSYLEIGLDSASIYGVDTPFPAHISFGSELFVGGAMLKMLSETLPGTKILSGLDADPTVRGFQGDGRLVFYFSTGEIPDGENLPTRVLDFSDLEFDISGAQARSLTSTLDPDWKSKNGIVDNEFIDERPESRIYETGVISDFEVALEDEILQVSFEREHQVIEVVVEIPSDAELQMDGIEIIGENYSETVVGTLAQDEIHGMGGHDDLRGDGGSDLISGGTGADRLSGGSGADVMFGNSSVDVLNGGRGDDYMSGGTGADTLFGERGDDYLIGGGGWDTLSGGDGDDELRGSTGSDILYGDDGDDELHGGSGIDTLWGGYGWDRIWGNFGQDQLFGDAGNDTLFGGSGNDQLDGGEDHDVLYGNEGDDEINGGTGDDSLFGGTGNDELLGGVGNDTISGAQGRDILNGGAGNDTLTGGTLSDIFVYESGGGRDTIRDFGARDILAIQQQIGNETSPSELLETYGSIEEEGFLIDFSAGNSIFLEGIQSSDEIADNLRLFDT